MPSPDDPYAWYFLPAHADLERDPSGRPMLTMVDLGTSGTLMFTARWASGPGELDALRAEIAARTGADKGEIKLSFAPIQSPRCEVLIREGAGGERVLATSSTSGYPPYHALFNLQLVGDDLATAKAAVSGRRGLLALTYAADLAGSRTVRARFRSRASDLLPWLRSRGDETDLRGLLEEAIRAGRAEILFRQGAESELNASSDLYDQVLSKVVDVLPRWLAAYETGDMSVDLEIDVRVSDQVKASADIGEIAGGRRAGA
jgi:hypothetical protein